MLIISVSGWLIFIICTFGRDGWGREWGVHIMSAETIVRVYMNKVPNLRPARQWEIFVYFKKEERKSFHISPTHALYIKTLHKHTKIVN